MYRILRESRDSRNPTPRAPTIANPNSHLPRANQAPCFAYITKGHNGCCRPNECQCCHIDLQDEATLTLRHEFFSKFMAFIQHPAVKAQFEAAQALLNFCRSNHIRF